MTRACLRALVAAILLLGTHGEAAQMHLQLEPQQRATVVGSGTSLRAVLEDLCWQAGVALRFDAADGPVALSVRDAPLAEVFGRLLEGRQYVMRTRADPVTSLPSVTALHVLGAYDSPGSSASPAPSLVVPERVLRDAFGEGPAADRSRALDRLVDDVRNDPQRLRAFLAADPTAMAASLRDYPGAAAALRQVAENPELRSEERARLEQLIDQINRQPGPRRRRVPSRR